MSERPAVIMSTQDADRLERLLESLPSGAFPGKAELEAELERAEVVEPEAIPDNVVTMNSTVKFHVQASGEEFSMTLVYPHGMDESGQTLSILAPVGSALLGLTQGDTIEWPKPGGGTLQVHIDEIIYQPERAGDYHR